MSRLAEEISLAITACFYAESEVQEEFAEAKLRQLIFRPDGSLRTEAEPVPTGLPDPFRRAHLYVIQGGGK